MSGCDVAGIVLHGSLENEFAGDGRFRFAEEETSGIGPARAQVSDRLHFLRVFVGIEAADQPFAIREVFLAEPDDLHRRIGGRFAGIVYDGDARAHRVRRGSPIIGADTGNQPRRPDGDGVGRGLDLAVGIAEFDLRAHVLGRVGVRNPGDVAARAAGGIELEVDRLMDARSLLGCAFLVVAGLEHALFDRAVRESEVIEVRKVLVVDRRDLAAEHDGQAASRAAV